MTKPQFERVWDVKIGGVNIDPQAVYTVTTNEIVPKFLDMFQIPYSDLEIKTGVSEYQTLMQYIATNSNLNPELFANNVFVSPITDVNDNPNQNVSSAYPNPSNGETTITALLDKPGNYTIKVVDTKGNLVFEKVENNLISSTNSIQMNLKSLMNGDYFYSIGNGEKAFYGKINIMK